MPFVWKAIVLPAMKVGQIRSEVKKELDKQVKALMGEFEKTTATWDHGVAFQERVNMNTGAAEVWTDDEIYGYVNNGTRPHDIKPRNASVLVFQGGYRAKTTPGTIQARGGGSSGPLVFSKGVHHPGTTARNFDDAIAKKIKIPFLLGIGKALLVGVVRAGLGKK